MTYDCVLFTDVTYPNAIYKPLGAYRLANHLRSNGYSCLVIDHFHAFTQQQTLDIVNRAVGPNTKFVGFSIAFFNSIEGQNPMDPRTSITCNKLDYNRAFCPQGLNFEIAIVSAIKESNSTCKIVLGGAARISAQINNPRVDYVISGFAEVAVIDLMQCLEHNVVPTNAIKNVWGTCVIDGGTAEAFDYQHSSMMWLPEDIGGAKVLQLDLSRGCKFNCNFCDWSMRGTKSNRWVRQVDTLVTELQRNYDLYGIYKYFIQDHTLNESDYKLSILKEVVKQLTFDPIFWCHARPDLLVKYPARTELMVEAGVRSMMMGIDTLDPTAAKLIGKGLNPEKIVAELKNIRGRYGNDLLTHGNFLIGLPTETIASVQKTAQRIESGEIPLHHWSYNAVMITTDTQGWWGSAFDQDPERFGYTADTTESTTKFNIDYRKNSLLNWRNDQMTFGQAMELGQQFAQSGAAAPHYCEDSMSAWAMMGFTDMELLDIQNLHPTTINWNSISRSRLRFLDRYKKQMLALR